ncbi:hypothetical protein LY78DRAFT_707921 [Colletotrichum sublineola]|nr:hypothetical protein LY78DRAFT_707921 [Colletotrichum sublineola]
MCTPFFKAFLSRKSNPSSQGPKNITQSNITLQKNPSAHPPTTQRANRSPPSIMVTTLNPTSNPYPRPAPDQPPPAYTATVTPQSAGGMIISTPEDPYAFLSSFDTIFLIDDSGSMAGCSWPEVQNAAGGYYGIRRAETVHEIFTTVRPCGATPTGQRLNAILRPHLQLLERKNDVESVKPINIIVITDGAPSDDVESTIISAAKKLDKLDAPMHQVGVRVDGDLRDMVDTVTWENGNWGVLTADSILKVVLGAVVRRLDRRRTSGESRR